MLLLFTPFVYLLLLGSFYCRVGETNGLKWSGVVRYVIRAFVDIPGAHHDLWVSYLITGISPQSLMEIPVDTDSVSWRYRLIPTPSHGDTG